MASPSDRSTFTDHSKGLSFIAGALAYFLVLYRFQTYTQRNHEGGGTLLVFAIVMFLIGFGFGIYARSPISTAKYSIFGVWAALAVVIWTDLHEDPTNHNLLPFEFIIMGIASCPAYLGALICRLTRGAA